MFGIIDEDGGGKASRAGVVFLRAAFAQAAHVIDLQLRHRFDAAAIGEIGVASIWHGLRPKRAAMRPTAGASCSLSFGACVTFTSTISDCAASAAICTL